MSAILLPVEVNGLAVQSMQTTGAPHVGVTVNGLHPSTPSVITVERSVDGRTWEAVRGLEQRTAVSAIFVRDHACPLNVPTTYRLIVHSGPDVPANTETQITLPSETAWISDPLSPRTAVAVTVDKRGTYTAIGGTGRSAGFGQVVDLASPAGATRPVASIGTRQFASQVPLILFNPTDDQAAMQTLLMGAGEILVRGLPTWVPLSQPATVALGPVKVDLVGTGGRWTKWTLDVTEVAPSSLRLAVPWLSWNDVMALWPGSKWSTLMTARPNATFIDWMKDPEG